MARGADLFGGLAGGLAGVGSGGIEAALRGYGIEGEALARKFRREDIDAQLKLMALLAGGQPTVSIHGDRTLSRDPRTGQVTIGELPPTERERGAATLQGAQTDAARARAERDRAAVTTGPRVTPIQTIEGKVAQAGLAGLTPGERALWDAHHKPERPASPHFNLATDDKGQVTQIISRVGPDGKVATEKVPLGAIGKAPAKGIEFSEEELGQLGAAWAKGQPISQLVPGWGTAANETRKAVEKRGLAILRGEGSSPADAALAYGARRAGLNTAQTQRVKVVPYIQAFNDATDYALELANRVDRTGVPAYNRWLLAGRKSIAGDADVAALDAQVFTMTREYARATSGSVVVPEGLRKEAQAKINGALTPQQFQAVADTMRRDTQYIINRLDAQVGDLKNPQAPVEPPPGFVPVPR